MVYTQGVQLSAPPNFRVFPSFQKETPYPVAVTPLAPLHKLPVTTNLLSVSMDLPLLDVSYKWNHTICALLQLNSFT